MPNPVGILHTFARSDKTHHPGVGSGLVKEPAEAVMMAARLLGAEKETWPHG